MKESQDLEREIKACEYILKQLNECLAIFTQAKSSKHRVKDTLKDIELVKAELKRLIAAKEAEREAGKGAAIDHEGIPKRSSKAVSQ
jgi:transcriptional regulator of heat shock response